MRHKVVTKTILRHAQYIGKKYLSKTLTNDIKKSQQTTAIQINASLWISISKIKLKEILYLQVFLSHITKMNNFLPKYILSEQKSLLFLSLKYQFQTIAKILER